MSAATCKCKLILTGVSVGTTHRSTPAFEKHVNTLQKIYCRIREVCTVPGKPVHPQITRLRLIVDFSNELE